MFNLALFDSLPYTPSPVLTRVLLRFEQVYVLSLANTPSPVLARVIPWFDRADVLPLPPRLPWSHVVYSQTRIHTKQGIYFGIVTGAVTLNPSRD